MSGLAHKDNWSQAADKNPFKSQWLDSCYQATLLPSAPWHMLEDKIAHGLAQRVEKQFNKADRKEALLQLLGEHFVDEYLPRTQWKPQLLEPPNMTVEDKQKLLKEAQAYLNSQMYKAVKEVGYQRMLSAGAPGDPTPPEYAEYLQHTFNVFRKGLDRELFLQEEKLTKNKREELTYRAHIAKKYRLPAPSRVKPVTSLSGTSSASLEKPSTGDIKKFIHKVEGDPPPLWGQQSDAIGQSVVSILRRDPRKFDHVAGRLHGRQLPGSLRTYMWADVLFRAERKRMKEVNVEKVMRERFAKAVTRGIGELRVSRPTQSPIGGLIDNAVTEIYNKTTGMAAFRMDEHTKEACRALNVLYVYDRSYEPYLIHWLFPLQLAFQNPAEEEEKTGEKAEHVYELAMFLDLLNTTCFPTWPQVFAIAEQVMSTLNQSDPEFYSHLKTISLVNVKLNKKDFLVQLIHEEKAKAEALLKATPGSIREQNMSEELLADPLIFLRRWIGEGFVSVLDTPSVMYVWDQCFMQGWQPSVLRHFCLAILQLLRYKFMEARDYMGMKQVFFLEPCKLYTVDIQMAWIHLESGKDLTDVPYLNRQRPGTPGSRLSQYQSAPPTPVVPGLLQPSGVKDIQLKLVIPSQSVQREPWLANVDPTNLKLHVAVYFGSIRLRSRMSMKIPVVQNLTKDSYGNTVYDVVFPEEKFVFDNLDLSQYDVERELGAFPYAIVRVEYYLAGQESTGKSPISVGYARIPLFQRSALDDDQVTSQTPDIQWVLQAGDFMFTLHPGEVPESLVSTLPTTPSEPEAPEENILGYNSELLAIVYDPRNEPPGRGRISPIPGMSSDSPNIPPTDTRQTPVPAPRRKTPKPAPAPRQPAPVRPKRPTPVDDPNAWVPHTATAVTHTAADATGLDKPFEFYIDSVRFIPDNASIIKVTGRILRSAEAEDIPDLMALPILDSPGRSPQFDFHMTLNTGGKEADPGMIIFLRVYTVDIITDQITVIGSCLLPVFEREKLRVGGHQYRLHSGVPVVKQGIANIKDTDLDNNATVPATTLLIRLLPQSKHVVPAPAYSTGYYFSQTCRPTLSEKRIFASYGEHTMMYPRTCREMIQRLQQAANITAGGSDKELLAWLADHLDAKKNLGENQPAENLSLVRCVRYKIKMGLNMKINGAYGLPEGLYIQCFARIAPGGKVLGMSPTSEGFGQEEQFVSLKHDYNSYQQAPVWQDDTEELHPFYDQYTCVLVQLFGMEVLYQPTADHNNPGKVKAVRGGELNLGDESIIGWAVVPLFEGNSVLQGTHQVPIFKNKPTGEILEQLTKDSAQEVLESQTWTTDTIYKAASMSVTVWDGHFEYDEVPELPEYEYLLESVGNLETFKKARNPPKNAKKIANLVIDSLESKYKKQGVNSAVYQKEQKFFEELMTKTFYDLMENALMTAGYGPL